ncbi:MAG: hypothetical protein HY725_01300 [Candidatus Rokubacteria bacterium]|nr:hypothetical protein [Candidatus Rokubacteria bacterium]
MATLTSPVQEVSDFWEWYELALKNGWTDGLVVAPPTEQRVARIIDYLVRDPKEVVGVIGPRDGLATIEQVAINCAMAGCAPEHVPVVIAALEAMLEPEFNLHGVQSTTNQCAPLVIVNGPVVRDLGFNAEEGAFGGGSRANACVGRAVRLILWNIGGGLPGETDMATQGQPAKYLFCAAENDEQSPWQPLHVERGFGPEQSAVTVFACQSADPLFVPGNGERILRIIASTLPTTGINMFHAAGQFLLSFGAKPAQELARAGYSKADVKRWVWENARYEVGWLKRAGVLVEGEAHMSYWGHGDEEAPDLNHLPDGARLPMVRSAEMIHIAVVGGASQWWMGMSAGWGNYGGYAVTKPIQVPRNA